MERHMQVVMDTFGIAPSPFAPQMFGNAGREHMQKYGKVDRYEIGFNFFYLLLLYDII